MVIDDRQSGDRRSAVGTSWRLVTDGVMGGVSDGRLTVNAVEGRSCLRLQGHVSLENNGGFVQMTLDVAGQSSPDASAYDGVLLDVHGNGETYNVHLRTRDLWLPWQSYRATFHAPPSWKTIRLPFASFNPYRTQAPLALRNLRRIGLVAIGREFDAELCLGRLALYRDG